MTYEELMKVNKEIKTTDIKGKEYAEVNQRIKAFRMLFPNGAIETDICNLSDGVCIIKATVKDENGKVLATGTAYEVEGSTFINKTSYIENCETSAIGRALGVLGIGIDTSVASYEEVSNAMAQQDADKTKSVEQMKIASIKLKSLKEKLKSENVSEDKILTLYKVNNLSDLTEKQFRNINDNWEKVKES